jgi:CubicO group peptidase (beta-lactamase class C family)
VSEAPGTAFDYNDYQTMLLWSLLYEKVNTATPDEATDKVLRPQLFDLIDAEDKPSLRIRGTANASGRLVISPRDFARLGLVYLHGGKWQDRQVISAEHVQLALHTPVTVPRTAGKDAEMLPDAKSYGGGKNQEEHLGCYSFMWWLNSNRKLWPSVPADAFAAVGNGGIKVMMVVPSLGIVVSWNDANMKPLPLCTEGKVQMEAVLKMLMAAVK